MRHSSPSKAPASPPSKPAKDLLGGLDALELPAEAIEVGFIADAWGIKGGFKVQAHSGEPEALFTSKRWFIQPRRMLPTMPVRTLLLPVTSAKEHGEGIVATSVSVPDRNTAEALKGSAVFVLRTSFPSTAIDEYYWVDLIGLSVVNRDGVAMGVVVDLIATGPTSVLVLKGDAAPDTNSPTPEPAAAASVERMIPFVSAYVDTVDLSAKRITVDWQLDY